MRYVRQGGREGGRREGGREGGREGRREGGREVLLLDVLIASEMTALWWSGTGIKCVGVGRMAEATGVCCYDNKSTRE